MVRMALRLPLVLLMVGFFATEVMSIGFRRKMLRQPNEDAAVAAINKAMMAPCSCDCCSVAKRLPDEQVKFSDGTELSYTCIPPPANEGTDTCPGTQCAASNSDAVLTASVETMDYQRFCAYKCKPSTISIGTLCIRLPAAEAVKTVDESGNGNSDVNIFAPAINEAQSWGQDGGGVSSASSAEEEAKKAEQAKEVSEHVEYDRRKIMEERFRAEAGADMSRASAAEARTKADAYSAMMNTERAERVQQAMTQTQDTGSQTEVESATHANSAEEAAAAVAAAEAEGKGLAAMVVQQAKTMAVAEIKKQAAAAAKQEAEADAYSWAWDKPKNWGKVLAARSADQYLKEMVAATQRVSEYEGYAKGLLGKAAGMQGKIMKLAPEANQYEAQGEHLGAATIRHEIDGLMGGWKAMEAEANKYWKIADDTRKTIPEWNLAATKAAARANWEFAITFTPPPAF